METDDQKFKEFNLKVEDACSKLFVDKNDWTFDTGMQRIFSKACLCASSLMKLERATGKVAYVLSMPILDEHDKNYNKGYEISILFYEKEPNYDYMFNGSYKNYELNAS